MVVIHYKRTEHNQFRWETTVQIVVDDLIVKIAEGKILNFPKIEIFKLSHFDLQIVNNMRIEIDKLASAIEGLAEHGKTNFQDLENGGLMMNRTSET